MLGLLELGFVLAIAVAWGAYELWSLRKPPAPSRSDDTDRPAV